MKLVKGVLLLCFIVMCSTHIYGKALFIDTNSFVSNQVLSRPTNQSITLSIVPKKALHVYFEYGTTPFVYPNATEIKTSQTNVPLRFLISGLSSNTRYYYRIKYKEISASQFIAGDQCTFITQRPRGSSFKFNLTSDSHLYDKKGIAKMMNITMDNILNDNPDFVMEMGDTFGDDRNPPLINQQTMMQLHYNFLPFIGRVAHSSPFYFCLGNHEAECGYYLNQTPPENLAVWGSLARKYYYANPYPDGFYTGNNEVEQYGIGQPENYYAWEWGDALFVVLDVYRYATVDPSPGLWDWTIGAAQYNWFKQTLESSNAKYKFVFAHHVRGYGRGAKIMVKNFEWGGYENNGTTWGFTTNRPGWAAPIHQLMVQNKVSVFFQGHDHLFAKETVDGLVYQEVPMPSDSTYTIGYLANADAYTDVKLNGTGHIRVTVNPNNAVVDYVKAYLPTDTNSSQHNGEIGYSYSVSPNVGITGSGTYIPAQAELYQNYPNPFNPTTKINYKISKQGFVSLKLYNSSGQEIAVLINESKAAGFYTADFNTENSDLKNLPSGIYFFQLETAGITLTKKAVLLK